MAGCCVNSCFHHAVGGRSEPCFKPRLTAASRVRITV